MCNETFQLKTIYQAILQVKQKTYVGASGWNYDDEEGFGVTEGNEDAWNSFVKQHTVFKPFKITSQFSDNADSQEPLENDSQSSLKVGNANPPISSPSSSSSPTTTAETPFPSAVPQPTPASERPSWAVAAKVAQQHKRTASELDGLDPPWSSSKCTKPTGPEALESIAHSVSHVGDAVFKMAPKKSSGMSPVKKQSTAHEMARKD
ncbi:hypothetical protein BDP27DRAFT_1374539 [Rhodocollybia butyracea]|uniref:Uncharacterized protein n=1 Tax=Rhodocollybia butyracea TaxID=206335 RepID=A0A9P5P5W9_9AGAR|nr:hypothetical protein BDP27DRAFT_1374539 [Rhodocollybia butyracea]